MNIESAKERKDELEKELNRLVGEKIVEFQKETGCKVSAVYVDVIDASDKEVKQSIVGHVEVNAEI